MSNLLLILIFAVFTWSCIQVSSVFGSNFILKMKQKQKLPYFKGAWVLTVFSVTTLLLFLFVLFGMALPTLLEILFDSPESVSASSIALGVLGSLCVSWLWALAKLRASLFEIYE